MKTLKLGAYLLLFSFLFLNVGCEKTTNKKEETSEVQDAPKKFPITKVDYGTTPEGEKIEKFTLKNANGMQMEVITFGGIITSLTAPDKDGKLEDIVLGYTTPDDYFNGNPYFFGAAIGRYGNRIAKGKFSLDGTEYQLATNDGPNHLHGGKKGFDKRIWTITPVKDAESPTLQLTYVSKDMEEGYPGTLTTTITYTLTDENALEISYEATTDKKTVVNLTQHSYFNLSGNFNTILDHELQLDADKMLPVDNTLIPTGELADVAGTPFDFTTAKEIGKDIDAADDQLKKGLGYDHCWVFNGNDKSFRKVGSLYHKASGRYMEVFTDQPAIQFYSGNFLDGTKKSKNGGMYEQRSGLCLETQHYPDSPNQPAFPSTVLNPGEKYFTKTTYKFSVK
ncbi:aldose epimerase family protein [Neptunitalea lumnitzerae]|uniref:Aldose 1-epimerase n=1 Tax=Neptunitalea lumnitzerae TaxID=2965509 RepID=A0ABQ5MG11_9FLAO|nr:aldose epimerase family protein [Neptunitalea sp. Y10]GLB48324.1 aldose 1-epimerase [Neptunitalea sp. Y10]